MPYMYNNWTPVGTQQQKMNIQNNVQNNVQNKVNPPTQNLSVVNKNNESRFMVVIFVLNVKKYHQRKERIMDNKIFSLKKKERQME